MIPAAVLNSLRIAQRPGSDKLMVDRRDMATGTIHTGSRRVSADKLDEIMRKLDTIVPQ